MQTHEEMERRRKAFMEKGFELFSEKSIEAVTLQDVANASGSGIATLYRYFSTKPGLLMEISAWKWGEFFEQNRKRHPADGFAGSTGAEVFEFYLDSFLEVFRNYRPLLKFNQFLNIYIRSEGIGEGNVRMYQALMQPVTSMVHMAYEKGKADGTLRTDLPEEEMLSVTLHLMLAAVTRYAVGLVYEPEAFSPERELELLKDMLLQRYRA